MAQFNTLNKTEALKHIQSNESLDESSYYSQQTFKNFESRYNVDKFNPVEKIDDTKLEKRS